MKFFLALSSLLLASAVNANGMGQCTKNPNSNAGVSDAACAKCHPTVMQMFWPCNTNAHCQGNCWFVGDPLPPKPPSIEVNNCQPIKQAYLPNGKSETTQRNCNDCKTGDKPWWPCNQDPPLCEGNQCIGEVFARIHAEEEAAAANGVGGTPGASAAEIAAAERDVCKASSRGDPHLRTFDGLKYDAHPKGEAILLTSDEPKLQIQGRLERANRGKGDPAVTTGIAIEGPEGSPTIQVNIAQPELVSLAGFGKKENGFCVKQNGHDQNHGVIKLDTGDYMDEGDLHRDCLRMCSEIVGATGCEMIWGQYNRGCYAHTADIHRGNGVNLHSCYLVDTPAELGTCDGYEDFQVGQYKCPVEMLVDGERVEGFTYESDLATASENNKVITIHYPGVVKAKVTLGHYGRCLLHTDVELYDCASYQDSAIGLLGSPDSNYRNDWMQQDGTPLTLPTGSRSFFFREAFDYVKENWMITDQEDSIFEYDTCAKFETLTIEDEEYNPELETLVDDADEEIKNVCGDDIQCIIDGETLGKKAAEVYKEETAADPEPVAPETEAPEPDVFCTEDVKTCADGSTVSRNPDNNCAFNECPVVVCAQDVQQCDDGSFVSRNPDNRCVFDECPLVVIDCEPGAQQCPDGTFVNRNPDNECAFDPCDTQVICTQDVEECPDGSFVSRNPENKCAFDACPEVVCALDVEECADGSFVSRNPDNGCAFDECPELVCTEEVETCADGSTVSRNPEKGCAFDPPCPQVFCAQDVQTCADGSDVSRNPDNGCAFDPCPETNSTPPPTPSKGSGSGDPHFKTWTGDKYDYHGECDLVLVDHPTFSNGLGLKIHIRTERIKYFSFISNIAVQIGDEVLEFDNDVNNFLINGEKVAPQRKHVRTLLSGFHVRRDPKAISIRFDDHIKAKIDLIQRKNGWPAVVVDGADTELFKGSLGLLGDWETGKRMARDGETEMNDPDATNFALEWQVRDTEPMLFQEARFPQYPRTCTPPTKNLSKRLGVSSFEKEAQKACAHWKQDMEDCIFDVIATRDITVAEEGHIGASVA